MVGVLGASVRTLWWRLRRATAELLLLLGALHPALSTL
ncbi:hypothetical protein ACVWXU_001083 [Streptomyces sp. TE33382]|jgi:hypothetical protein